MDVIDALWRYMSALKCDLEIATGKKKENKRTTEKVKDAARAHREIAEKAEKISEIKEAMALIVDKIRSKADWNTTTGKAVRN